MIPSIHQMKLRKFLKDYKVTWWRTPAESPDCNPIENLWHKLKEHIQGVKKPKTKQELTDGIKEFWDELTVTWCVKYINYLQKVLPKVIVLNGAATGYYLCIMCLLYVINL